MCVYVRVCVSAEGYVWKLRGVCECVMGMCEC